MRKPDLPFLILAIAFILAGFFVTITGVAMRPGAVTFGSRAEEGPFATLIGIGIIIVGVYLAFKAFPESEEDKEEEKKEKPQFRL